MKTNTLYVSRELAFLFTFCLEDNKNTKLLRFFDELFDVINDDLFLTLSKTPASILKIVHSCIIQCQSWKAEPKMVSARKPTLLIQVILCQNFLQKTERSLGCLFSYTYSQNLRVAYFD
jgi:hypothetical protein